jgi:exocyst complex component 2
MSSLTLSNSNEQVDIVLFSVQDKRLLLVISNFKHLSNAVIPSMLVQLEGAFGLPMSEDRKVRVRVLSLSDPC